MCIIQNTKQKQLNMQCKQINECKVVKVSVYRKLEMLNQLSLYSLVIKYDFNPFLNIFNEVGAWWHFI